MSAPSVTAVSWLDADRRAAAEAALAAAAAAGVSHAHVRVEEVREVSLRLRDTDLQGGSDHADTGLSVRLLLDGTWGFAASSVADAATAVGLVDEALAVARAAQGVTNDPVVLAEEPSYGEQVWSSPHEIDPVDVPADERVGRLTQLAQLLLDGDGVDHVDTFHQAVRERTFFADLAGNRISQQRVRLFTTFSATHIGKGRFESLRTIAPPVGVGWEYMLPGGGFDWEGHLAEMPAQLAEKVEAPGVTPGVYDLVIDPTQLWLTIHESIGHATELDRALGFEAAYAGTSFATPDQLGSLRYGSPVMTVTGDRQVAHGLATVAFDHEGVAAQTFPLVTAGVLTGFQTDRSIAGKTGADRSNGCAFADSVATVPLQRMANVSLAADPDGPDLEGLLATLQDGLYLVGDNSWSIDMQRYNFQFTAQRAHVVKGGKIVGQVRDLAYQGTTTQFWGGMEVVGGPSTWKLQGAMNCGKGQPGQTAPVSHGCPAVLIRGVRILNTTMEGSEA